MTARRSDLRPALAVSGGLHLLALAALLVSLHFAPPLTKPMQVVAVDVISSAEIANVRAAAKAPTRQTAAEPEPAPPSAEPPTPEEAPEPPTPAPPPPAPEPTPRPEPRAQSTPRPKPVLKTEPAPKPQPVPKPQARPEPKPRAEPKPKPPPKPAPDLDLDSLSKPTKSSAATKSLDLSALSKSHSSTSSLDLTALASTSGGHRASAARGAARASTDLTAHNTVGAGTALDAASIAALKAKITRLWNPECGVKVDVRIRLQPNHSLASRPTVLAHSTGTGDDAAVTSATQHALAAVEQAAPFTELPANAPRDLVLHFTPTDGCSG